MTNGELRAAQGKLSYAVLTLSTLRPQVQQTEEASGNAMVREKNADGAGWAILERISWGPVGKK